MLSAKLLFELSGCISMTDYPKFILYFDPNDRTVVFDFTGNTSVTLANQVAKYLTETLITQPTTWDSRSQSWLKAEIRNYLKQLIEQKRLSKIQDIDSDGNVLQRWAYYDPELNVELV